MLALCYETTRHNFNACCHNCDFKYHRKVVLGITGELLERQACKERSTPLFPVLRTMLSGLPLLCPVLCLQLSTPAGWMQPTDTPWKLMGCLHGPVLSLSAGALHLEHGESVKQMQGRDLFLSFQLLFRISTPPR